jgi:hypothetical protein
MPALFPLNPTIQTQNNLSIFAGYFVDLATLDLFSKSRNRSRASFTGPENRETQGLAAGAKLPKYAKICQKTPAPNQLTIASRTG